MRLVVQRVKKAEVKVEGGVVGKISRGFLVLLGIKKGDTKKEAELLADKLSKLRVMADEEGKMNLSVGQVGAKILVISQFTLHAETGGGNRPSFINAEEPIKAKKLYECFVGKLKENGLEVETGSFGDYMQIEVELDGPVTILYLD